MSKNTTINQTTPEADLIEHLLEAKLAECRLDMQAIGADADTPEDVTADAHAARRTKLKALEADLRELELAARLAERRREMRAGDADTSAEPRSEEPAPSACELDRLRHELQAAKLRIREKELEAEEARLRYELQAAKARLLEKELEAKLAELRRKESLGAF